MISKNILDMKLKGKCPRGRLESRWELQVMKDATKYDGGNWGGRVFGSNKIMTYRQGRPNVTSF
jgi:hypothetical protein